MPQYNQPSLITEMSPDDIILLWKTSDGACRTITFEDMTSAFQAGAGTPGGSPTQLQFNNAGSFGGITKATWNGTSLTLTDVTLSGIPTAPTASHGTNTAQIATTAFVIANAGGGGGGGGIAIQSFDSAYPSSPGYTVGMSANAVNVTGTPTSVILTAAGKYRITATYTIEWGGPATSTALTAVLANMRRVNNTPADLPKSSDTALVEPVTSALGMLARGTLDTIYETMNTDDNIQVFSSYQGAGADGGGVILIRQMNIIAVQLS